MNSSISDLVEDQIHAPDDLDSFEFTESDVDDRKVRSRKPYKEATLRPSTLSETIAGEESELFGDIMADTQPSLNDVYITSEQLHELRSTNGYKAISLFSGCAGSGTGFSWAGWKELMAVEFVKAARETIAANYPSSMVEPERITKYVHKWLKKNPDSPVDIRFTKPRVVKKQKHAPIVNWEETIEAASLLYKETGDKLPVEELFRLRYEVSVKALKKSHEDDTLTLWGDDIRGLDPQAILDVFNLKPGELDCLEGSPPCKSFSMSGIREGGWGQVLHYSDERNQRTDDLFIEFVRILKALMPKTFIAENVAGMMAGSAASDVVRPLLAEFDKMGYRIEAKIINSKDYGVPQSRPRVFFIGIRKDLVDIKTGAPATYTWPERNSRSYVLQDALDAAGESPAEELKFANIEKYEAGKIWRSLPIGASPENKAYQFMRCHPNLPVPTITATSAFNAPAAGPTHPYECRKFTVKEMRYLFGFPIDYKFTGSIAQQGERMGRSVTPYVMKQLASNLADVLSSSESDGSVI